MSITLLTNLDSWVRSFVNTGNGYCGGIRRSSTSDIELGTCNIELSTSGRRSGVKSNMFNYEDKIF
jgi:hypothetical protein